MKIYLNLLPEEKKRKVKRRKIFWLIIRQETLFLFAVVFLIAFLLSTNFILKIQSDGVDSANTPEQSQQSYNDIKTYEDKFKETNEKTAAFLKIAKSHLYWSGVLDRLSNVAPDGVSISSLVTKNYQISLAGRAKNRDDLLKFQENIGKDDCFSDINAPLSNFVTKENVDFQIDFKVKQDCLKQNK